jgi:hypothetical protein
MAKTRIYFVSDLHGSNVCFRKFINAARIYDAKVLVLGGDVAGKAIQSIVRAPGGRWQCRFVGKDLSWSRWRSSSLTTATTRTAPTPASSRRWKRRAASMISSCV